MDTPVVTRSHNTSDVIVAGVLAGSVAGFTTNAIEYLAVNKQTDPNFSVKKFLQEKDALYRLLLKGCAFRTVYYGTQACLMFYMLEEFKIFLNCEQIDD